MSLIQQLSETFNSSQVWVKCYIQTKHVLFKCSVSLYQWTIDGFFLVSKLLRVGIEIPTIEVRFEHLNIKAEAHIGDRALPTVMNFTCNILEVILTDNTIQRQIQILMLVVFFLLKSFDVVICLSFSKGFLNTFHVLPSQKKPASILHDLSGIIQPYR